ncbi:MAG: hypothetical protein OEO23_06655, partial [Gemmatimonadota bacterium]|nr:hypothetical protein [Gemmatimonadota bacterium]
MMGGGFSLQLLVTVALSFAVAAGAVPVLRSWALARGRVVEARPDRWHEDATPAVGGVGIFAAAALGLAVGLLVVEKAPGGRSGWGPLDLALV